MAKAALWLKDLRSLVRREHGAGWVLEGANDRFKIQKIEGERRGAKRPTVRTQIPFAPSSSTEIVNLVNTLSENMRERNIGLGDAFQLLNNAPIDKTSNAIDWEEIKNKYYTYRVKSGTVKETNFKTNEEYKITRVLDLINAPKNAAYTGKEAMEKYSNLHLKDLPTGSEGRKRNLLDIARFLDFAVDECGIDIKWKPVGKAYLQKLIGKLEKPKLSTVPIKPDQLFALIDSLFDKPELKLAVSLVGLFGLRPAELIKLNFEDGRLFVGQVKRNSKTTEIGKEDRLVMALNINELPDEGTKVVKQFFNGEVKLPKPIHDLLDPNYIKNKNIERAKNGKPPLSAFKECGAYFRQYLERHDYWKNLVNENEEITPYSLRHGYAWRGAKYYSRSIPLRDLSKLMGHSPKTHNKYYGIWTDNQDLIETVEKIAS